MPYEMFNYPITAPFGHTGNMHTTPHTGVDLATPTGVKAQALFTGKVMNVTLNDPILGKAVYLQSPSGEQLVYGHLSDVMVYEGQTVLQGHILGLTGNTGRSTAEHLHIALFDKGGIPLDITSVVDGSGSWIDNIANRVGTTIGDRIIDFFSKSGFFLLDCFKVMILMYMIWCCYCMMMKRNRIGLAPFADMRPMDALAFNAMFLFVVTMVQGVLA